MRHPSPRRALVAALALDLSFLVAEVLLEGVFHTWIPLVLPCLMVVFGFWMLRLMLGYSIALNVPPARTPLHLQLRLPWLRGPAEFTQLVGGLLGFLVATGIPFLGLNLAMEQLGIQGGMDAFEPGTAARNAINGAFVLVFVISMIITYGSESLFQRLPRIPGDEVVFAFVVPILALFIGAALSPVAQLLTASMGDTTDGSIMAGLYIYLPMRYLLCRVAGLTRISLVLWIACSAAFFLLG